MPALDTRLTWMSATLPLLLSNVRIAGYGHLPKTQIDWNTSMGAEASFCNQRMPQPLF